MAVDKLVDSTQLNADLTSVANAIRTKGGTSAQLAFPDGFVSAIGDIPTGGTLPHLLDHVEYTMVTDADSSSRQSIQLTAVGSSRYVVFLTPKVVPAPPASGYTAYNWVKTDVGSGATLGSVIRPDGTAGTDQNMASFNSSTGVLSIGGQYGTFRTGQVFDIYLFELT